MFNKHSMNIPAAGQWPIGPQTDVEVSKDRIWVDGCFDFSHHGHAGAMLQARRLGKYLLVGVHSDEEILENKGPTVMSLKERLSAVDACRWSTLSIPAAPYVTSLPWISHYGCYYVVHGDDITSDSSGEDCYRYVKAAGRFLVVRRTPGISTTDLVGRMLLCTKTHFIKSLTSVLAGQEGSGSSEDRLKIAQDMSQRIKDYATDETGLRPGPIVLNWVCPRPGQVIHEQGVFDSMVNGKAPLPGQRIIYVDGGFDLFSSGHIEFLRRVVAVEEEDSRKSGWFEEAATKKRVLECGDNYGPTYIVAGVHDDEVINEWKGLNYPIMNIFERGLCVLQCRYINCVIFSAPFSPTTKYLNSLPFGTPSAVYHGPTSFIPLTFDPYAAAKDMKLYREISNHDFQHVNAGEIVQRIMKSREMYEERQRSKLEKARREEATQREEQATGRAVGSQTPKLEVSCEL